MVTLTPPMGWNSWNTFGENISDQLIRETADRMVSEGYLDAGYNYLVIDDCWSKRERNAEGRIEPDPVKFPNGMKAVADYVHSKGLKFGMYSCAGTRTCANYPGSYGHEFVDAQTFADWGVDFLKYDYCYKPAESNGEILYRRMAMALRATGRDILFSACSWGTDDCGRFMRSAGANMYRSTGDIQDNFASFRDIYESQKEKLCYGAANCFNDMDMLIVGMYGKGNVGIGGCNDAEYRSHFAMWCLCGSPLMMGGDLRNMSEECKKLLLNRELIAINQDPETRSPFFLDPIWADGTCVFKLLANGDYAIGLFNKGDTEQPVRCLLNDAGLAPGSGYGFRLHDVFTGEDAGIVTELMDVKVPSHDCKVYRASLVRV